MVFLDSLDAANASAHHNPDRVAVHFCDLEACVLDSLYCRGDAVVYERVHLARVFRRQELVNIEILNDSSNTRRESAGIKFVDDTNTGDTVAYVVPSFV